MVSSVSSASGFVLVLGRRLVCRIVWRFVRCVGVWFVMWMGVRRLGVVGCRWVVVRVRRAGCWLRVAGWLVVSCGRVGRRCGVRGVGGFSGGCLVSVCGGLRIVMLSRVVGLFIRC